MCNYFSSFHCSCTFTVEDSVSILRCFGFDLQVQNADDNSYGPGVEAALVFVVQPHHIVVFNNEDGFTPENLRSLCDVGNSTKAGTSTGYIGHKGIGFKSVFRV